jgi:hypothetical protein
MRWFSYTVWMIRLTADAAALRVCPEPLFSPGLNLPTMRNGRKQQESRRLEVENPPILSQPVDQRSNLGPLGVRELALVARAATAVVADGYPRPHPCPRTSESQAYRWVQGGDS